MRANASVRGLGERGLRETARCTSLGHRSSGRTERSNGFKVRKEDCEFRAHRGILGRVPKKKKRKRNSQANDRSLGSKSPLLSAYTRTQLRKSNRQSNVSVTQKSTLQQGRGDEYDDDVRHSFSSLLPPRNLTLLSSLSTSPFDPIPINGLASMAIIPFQHEYTGTGRASSNRFLASASERVEESDWKSSLRPSRTSLKGSSRERNVLPFSVRETQLS